jgi:hypothetical protein
LRPHPPTKELAGLWAHAIVDHLDLVGRLLSELGKTGGECLFLIRHGRREGPLPGTDDRMTLQNQCHSRSYVLDVWGITKVIVGLQNEG